MNNHINSILYNCYLTLRKRLGASIVHRRKRKSSNCIEIVFCARGFESIKGHLNPLKDAEKCGFWIICRPQNKRGHTTYHGLQVFQLFLSPVHPKKRREQALAVSFRKAIQTQQNQLAQEISFEPIEPRPSHAFLLLSACPRKFVVTSDSRYCIAPSRVTVSPLSGDT